MFKMNFISKKTLIAKVNGKYLSQGFYEKSAIKSLSENGRKAKKRLQKKIFIVLLFQFVSFHGNKLTYELFV